MGTQSCAYSTDIDRVAVMASSVSFMDDRSPSHQRERYEEPKTRYQARSAPMDRFGPRSQSTGRYDSDRSIEERHSRGGGDGDSLTISDFFKYGRGGRVYERPEGFRRPPSARSQSLGRLDAERYLDERYGPRYFEDGNFSFDRYPRDYYDDRYMRDMYDDRMARDMHIDRFGRPVDDRFFYDRYGPERPMGDRFREDRYPFDRHPMDRSIPPAGERMPDRMNDRMSERFYDRYDGNDRHDRERNYRERYGNDRSLPSDQRYGNDRFDRQASYEKKFDRRSSERQGADKNGSDRYSSDRQERSSEKNDRYRTDPANAERDEKFTNDRASNTERGSTSGERFPKFQ